MEMISLSDLIPTAETLRRRGKVPAGISICDESRRKMSGILRENGYAGENTEVFRVIRDYGAMLMDDIAVKGLMVKGPVGIGKSFGVEILARHFGIPVFNPSLLVSLYKKVNGNPIDFEKLVVTGCDFFEHPNDIVIDELGAKDSARNYGETVDLMCDVLEIRYRAFLNYGVRTIVTTNLEDAELDRRYGLRINDRFLEMFYFRSVTGKSLRG